MPLLEAMACGVPVLTTACQGPEAFIQHEHNGIIVRNHEAAAMAQQIIALIGNPDQRETLAQQALQDAQTYRWRPIAQQYIVLFHKLLA